jgi:hypothetical protein
MGSRALDHGGSSPISTADQAFRGGVMNMRIEKPEPACRRCQGQLRWHAREEVEVKGDLHRMDVYRCDGCGMLSARDAPPD